MSDLSFFDMSCVVGRRGILHPGSFYKTETLLDEMEKFGIKEALVYHAMAREYHAAEGNALLMKEIAGYPCLKPVWVVMPHHTGEFYEPDILIHKLAENNVKAVRMFPGVKEHNYSLAQWNCGELLSALERNGVVLMIGHDQASWGEVYDLCWAHPALKVILTDLTYRVDRNLYPLLAKFKNLLIETCGYKVNSGIEEIVRRFGSNRLIFGSGMPAYSAGAAVAMVSYAQIDEGSKQDIAGGNLKRLLGEVHV